MHYLIGAGKLSIYEDIQRQTLEHEKTYPNDFTARAAIEEYVANVSRTLGTWVVLRSTRDGSAGHWSIHETPEDAHRCANGVHPVTAPGVILGPDGTAYHMPGAPLDRFLAMVRRA